MERWGASNLDKSWQKIEDELELRGRTDRGKEKTKKWARARQRVYIGTSLVPVGYDTSPTYL